MGRATFDTTSLVLFAVVMSTAVIASGANPATTPASEAAAAKWTALGGLYEGNVRAILEDPAGVIWVATASTGIFESRDGGETWNARNDGLTNYSAVCLCVDPKSGDVFAGLTGPNGGVFRMAKGGKSWKAINDGFPARWDDATNRMVSSLAMNKAGDILAGYFSGDIVRLPAGAQAWKSTGKVPTQTYNDFAFSADGRIWAAGLTAIVTSTDDGATWTTVAQPSVPHVMSVAVDDKTGALYAGGRIGKWGGNGGFFRSTDNGKTWTGCGLRDKQVNCIRVVGDKIFAGCRLITDFGEVWVSEDRGATWKQLTKGLENLWGVHTISVTKQGIFIGANGAYRSTDGGASFKKLNVPAMQYCGSIAIMPNGDIYTGGDREGGFNAHGIAKLAHGRDKWEAVNKGLISVDITSLLVNGAGELLAADRYQGSYRLGGDGTWIKASYPGLARNNRLLLTADKNVVAADVSGMFLSEDGGKTYRQTASMGDAKDAYVAPNGDILAGVEWGAKPDVCLIVSKDNGKTFKIESDKYPPTRKNTGWTVGTSPDGTILMSFGDGIDHYLGDSKWQNASRGFPPGIGARKFLLNSAGKVIFAATSKGVFYSADAKDWKPLNNGLDGQALDVHTLQFDSEGNLYAGTVNGLFKIRPPQ